MLLNLLFPRRCLGCSRHGQYFCVVCRQKVRFKQMPICPACGQGAISGKTHLSCCAPQQLDGLVSLFNYEGMVKKAIIKLKYKYVTDLAEELVSLAAKRLLQVAPQRIFFEGEALTIIPVPLHPRRERQRGFNQSLLLGKLLAREFGWRIEPNSLVREKYTRPQTKLKGKERRHNIKGVFGTMSGSSIPRHSQALVFDDVWTTGSTLKECGRVLKRAGVKNVWGLTLAR